MRPFASKPWLLTRRSFVGSLAMTTAGLCRSGWAASLGEADQKARRAWQSDQEPPRYRAVSWWLTWDDLSWPNEALMDNVRRRADACASSAVNCCIIFGAHFRWDFMPIWDRLHDLLRFIGTELHERQIVLFDHHSSVLTHRPRNREEALNIWRRNRHHIPFYPSNEKAATLEFNGSRLNDWRMIDVETGQPAYMPAYNSEQYCMNNPEFRAAYASYVKKLLADTGIDGLMSDDGIYYAGWQACGCKHCRQRFKQHYHHTLPAAGDLEFWGNRRSEAFRDWIQMRFETCGDFLANVKSALPPGFPLLTCCSSSDSHLMPSVGMSYQDFIRSCNLVMLEMTGSTPAVTGTWDERIPSQLLHLGIAGAHRVPCIGLGYGFFPDTAFFVWAFNKFLGSDCWFSTLKGRLSGEPTDLERLADDADLVGEGYRWEKARPHLFKGKVDAECAVFFSRSTRDFYGQCYQDYVSDYHATCLSLLRADIPCEVLTEIPGFGKTRKLVLSSVLCLSADEQRRITEFMKAGGTVIATGPTGHYDQRAKPLPKPWLAQFGLVSEIVEPSRPGAFPPYSNLKPPIAVAEVRVAEASKIESIKGWHSVRFGRGQLLWRPKRTSQPDTSSALVDELRSQATRTWEVQGLPPTWRVRAYREGNRLVIHALPAKIGTVLHASLQNEFARQRIIEKLQFKPLEAELVLRSSAPLKQVRLHSPDLAAARFAQKGRAGWAMNASGISRYLLIECVG